MKPARPLLVLVMLAAGGCGQKGPLYLPDKGGRVVTSSPAAPLPAPAPAATTPAVEPPAATPPANAAPAESPPPKPTDKDKDQDSQPPK